MSTNPTNQTEKSKIIFWICADCDFAVVGDDKAACKHLFDGEGFSHYIYEFVNEGTKLFPYEPTLRSIHSSDSSPGSYYFDHYQMAGEVYESIARMRVTNRLAHKAFKEHNETV